MTILEIIRKKKQKKIENFSTIFYTYILWSLQTTSYPVLIFLPQPLTFRIKIFIYIWPKMKFWKKRISAPSIFWVCQ